MEYSIANVVTNALYNSIMFKTGENGENNEIGNLRQEDKYRRATNYLRTNKPERFYKRKLRRIAEKILEILD